MKVALSCVLAVLAGAASAATSDETSMPSAREYFFSSAYVQVCSGGSVVDTPSLKALREQTVAYYHALFAREGEDADTKRIIGNIGANILPGGLVDAVKALKPTSKGLDSDLVCRMNDAVIRRQIARHDVAMSEQGLPGAKPLEEARAALRALAGDAATLPKQNPDPSRRPRANTHDPSCRPEYPARAIRLGVKGKATVRFGIDVNGLVTAWDIRGSAGPTLWHGLLDFAVVEALSRCPFEPEHDAEGRAIPGSIDVEYSWLLD